MNLVRILVSLVLLLANPCFTREYTPFTREFGAYTREFGAFTRESVLYS
ncbi:hypothetical protein RCO48_13055 [Peribacillus frigoritolerans]|nr:hypothetical protein [Peribacillus frigoritolerans]